VGRVELRRSFGTGRIALVTMALVATMLPLDPGRSFRQGNIFMTKDAVGDETPKAAVRDTTTPPARDPEVAVQEEYQAARHRGTAEALELFIARHPDSALAEKARADLRQLPR
jgi:hypothetical protein